MEDITIENFQTKFSKTIINKAKKLTARDLEEASPNKFLAYVDEGLESYDVGIEIKKDKIVVLSCDCQNNLTLCVHKIVLINAIKSKKSTRAVSIKRKKKSESDSLLEELDEKKLRIWAQELFKKNKDIELLFVNEFANLSASFDEKEVELLIDKAIKSVIKTKKSIDNTELKRVIDILDISLKPVITYCKENVLKPETNKLLLYTCAKLYDFNSRMVSGVKMIRFIEKLYKEINHHIHNIKNKEEWELIINNKGSHFFREEGGYYVEEEVFFHLYDSIDTKERKAFFATIIFDIFTISIQKEIKYIKEVNHFILKVLAENTFFEKVYIHFEPLRFENDYNVFLIEKLIEINKYDEAEEIAIDQIEGNYNEKYNLTYYKLLQKIYDVTKEEKKIALLQMKLIFLDFSLDAYKLIQVYSEKEDFKSFRTKLLTSLKRNFYSNKESVRGYFEILFYEQKFKNMIDNISEHTSYELLYDYKEQLFLYNKEAFLDGLMRIEKSTYYFFRETKFNTEFRDKIIQWIQTKYDKNTIKLVCNKIDNKYNSSEFLHELKTFAG